MDSGIKFLSWIVWFHHSEKSNNDKSLIKNYRDVRSKGFFLERTTCNPYLFNVLMFLKAFKTNKEGNKQTSALRGFGQYHFAGGFIN